MSRPYFNNPIPRTGTPNFSELSTLTSPRESDAVARSHIKDSDNTYNLTAIYHAMRQLQSQVNRLRIRSTSPATLFGWQWQIPQKELDPTVAVAKNTVVYISPENPIATTGLTDLILDELMVASPGVWICIQDVPPEITVDSVVMYNMPQVLTSGSVSGTPLQGDADNANVFWIPLAGVMNCG